LIAGIAAAWALGGIAEELIARGIVLTSLDMFLAAYVPAPLAAGIALCAAAVGAGAMHAYQGLRAVVIITQLSVLFGMLFVLSGHNLWAVILCHGLYDTIAFVRFATKHSPYSRLDQDQDQKNAL
jgi:membrane protease YdiL (CAAX protease family)